MTGVSLLPCPFCGSPGFTKKGEEGQASCSGKGCPASYRWVDVDKWNTRIETARVFSQFRISLLEEREGYKRLEAAVRKAFRRYDDTVNPADRSAIFDLIKTKRRKRK